MYLKDGKTDNKNVGALAELNEITLLACHTVGLVAV